MKRSGNRNNRLDNSHQHPSSHASACCDQTASLELKMIDAQLGDQGSLAELVIHHRPIIEKSATRLLAAKGLATTTNIERATDRTCDQAFKLFETHYQQHESMKGFRSWLRALLSNQIRDLLKFLHAGKRDRRREKPLNAASDSSHGCVHHAPPDIVIAEEETRSRQFRLQQALVGLNDRDRQLILMRHYLGWQWSVIAEVLSMPSTESAKTAGWRAMVMVRGRLEGVDQRA